MCTDVRESEDWLGYVKNGGGREGGFLTAEGFKQLLVEVSALLRSEPLDQSIPRLAVEPLGGLSGRGIGPADPSPGGSAAADGSCSTPSKSAFSEAAQSLEIKKALRKRRGLT